MALKKNEPKAPLNSFTKAELIRTVKKQDTRITTLLNRIAKLEALPAAQEHKLFGGADQTFTAHMVFPWETGK